MWLEVRPDVRMNTRLDVRDLAPAAPARAVPAEMAAAVHDSLHSDVAQQLDGVVAWRRRWKRPWVQVWAA